MSRALIRLNDSRDFAIAQGYSDATQTRLYCRWIGELLAAAADDLDDHGWDSLMARIERAKKSRVSSLSSTVASS